MKTPVKLGSFVAVLAAVFGLAYLTGTQSQALLAPVHTHGAQFRALSDTIEGYTVTPHTIRLGHAVIIRPGDLGYLHLHSLPSSENGPRLEFVGGCRSRAAT
jgi:hypothetical protein